MRNKFKLLVAMAAVAALALTGCAASGGGEAEDKPFKVIAFTSGNQTPVGAWWVKAVTAKAEELGWELTMIQGDFDFQKMNPAVESAIAQGADAIFDGYTDYASISSITAAAADAGIPIFAMDSGVEPTDAFAINVTTDQQGIVDSTVEALSTQLGGLKGKNIMVPLLDVDTRMRTLNEFLQYTQPKLKSVEVKMSGTLDLTSEQLDNRLNMLLAKAAK